MGGKFDARAAVEEAFRDAGYEGLGQEPGQAPTVWIRDGEAWSARKTSFCPRCGAPEMHPDGEKLLVRAYKVDNMSECLVCASADPAAQGGYDKNLVWNKAVKLERARNNEAWF